VKGCLRDFPAVVLA
jgi:hypothetical protein